jgi:hypothetical protein
LFEASGAFREINREGNYHSDRPRRQIVRDEGLVGRQAGDQSEDDECDSIYAEGFFGVGEGVAQFGGAAIVKFQRSFGFVGHGVLRIINTTIGSGCAGVTRSTNYRYAVEK